MEELKPADMSKVNLSEEQETALQETLTAMQNRKVTPKEIDDLNELLKGAAVSFRPSLDKIALPDVMYDWKYLATTCINRMQADENRGGDPYKSVIILQVSQPQNTKMNRVRLVKSDKNSPMGLVVKGDGYADMRNYPYASGKFNAKELAEYAAHRITPEDFADDV